MSLSQQSATSSGFRLNIVDGDSALRAEILQALKVVKSNISFASANEDAEQFNLQLHDSEIVKSYAMGETKLKYLLGVWNLSIPKGVRDGGHALQLPVR